MSSPEREFGRASGQVHNFAGHLAAKIWRYMDILWGKEGWLVIFGGRSIDPKAYDAAKIWDTRIYWDSKTFSGGANRPRSGLLNPRNF
jgi:hypothetical protein